MIQESVGDSPLEDTKFQPGTSGNPGGRPKGSKNKPRSKMRTSLEKLYTIQDDAIETIRHQLTGKDKDGNTVKPPSKDKVDMAKFVIKAIESYNSSCLSEEKLILGVKEKDPVGGQAMTENSQDTTPPAFSLDMADETTH